MNCYAILGDEMSDDYYYSGQYAEEQAEAQAGPFERRVSPHRTTKNERRSGDSAAS